VVALAPDEVYVDGTAGCGLDPSFVFNRPIERFDGKAWRELRGSALSGTPHDAFLGAMAVARKGPLWVLAAGDFGQGGVANAILRWKGSTYGPPARRGLSAAQRAALDRAIAANQSPFETPTSWESYRSIVARDDGAVWVVGAEVVATNGGAELQSTPASWFFDGKQWLERPFPPMPALPRFVGSETVSLGEDGSVWAGGDGLFRWDADHWTRVELGFAKPLHVTSVWARNASEIWLVANTKPGGWPPAPLVLHFDGQRLARLVVEAVPGLEAFPSKLAGRGASLWALDRAAVWRRAPATTATGEAQRR
jgi:hypothetical protein